MKILLILLFTFQACLAEEAYFFELEQKKPKITIEGNTISVATPIKRVKPPKALAIMAYHQGLGAGRDYQIQVDLSKKTKKDWIPKLKLGADILMEGVIVSRPSDEKFPHAFHIESNRSSISLRCVFQKNARLQL